MMPAAQRLAGGLLFALVLTLGGCAPQMIPCGRDGPVADNLVNSIRCETRIRAERAQDARAEDIRQCVAEGGETVGCRQAAGPVH
jgi:hypothetical protein